MNNSDLKSKNIFISYAREDWNNTKRLYGDLNSIGFKPWMDTEDLLPGQNWEETIYDAIRNSAFFIALLSSRSLSKRGYVQKELKIALDYLDEFPPNNIFVIPVLLEDCKPIDKRLTRLHWIRLDESYDSAFYKLVKVMAPNEHERLIPKIQDMVAEHKRMPPPPVAQKIVFRLWDRPNILSKLLNIFYANNLGLISVQAIAHSTGMAEVICEIETKVSEDFIKSFYQIEGLVHRSQVKHLNNLSR